jgi:uncharacterized protein (UPF0332 family)
MDSRESLAEQLMEEAEHSSEIAMRASLSRAYYALHHLGIALTGETNHGRIRETLRFLDARLGDEYAYFMDLRHKADYDPQLLSRQYGSLDQFRLGFREDLARARELFERLREELQRQP